jgi:hypothetical protein
MMRAASYPLNSILIDLAKVHEMKLFSTKLRFADQQRWSVAKQERAKRRI